MDVGERRVIEERFRGLLEAGRGVLACESLSQVLERIGAAARDLLGAAWTCVLVPGNGPGVFEVAWRSHGTPDIPTASPLLRLAREALERRQPVFGADIPDPPAGRVAAVPLQGRDGDHGVLLLEGAQVAEWDWSETLVLDALAECATVSCSHLRVHGELQSEKDKLQSLLHSMADGVVATDERGLITYFGPGAEEILGWRAEEVLGKPVVPFLEGGEERARSIKDTLRRAGKVTGLELRVRTRGAELVPANLSASILRGTDGRLAGAIGVLKEISRQKDLEARLERTIRMLQEANEALERLATTDSLSGLFNHRVFFQRLHLEMDRSNRTRRPLALLMIDIDRFKLFNDNYGHLVGDHVIEEIGRVLRAVLRKIDVGCRYGGEEFTAILPETGGDSARVAAQRILDAFAKSSLFERLGIRSATLSIGIAEYRPEVSRPTPSDLVRAADGAMYEAKASGGNRIVLAGWEDPSERAGQGLAPAP